MGDSAADPKQHQHSFEANFHGPSPCISFTMNAKLKTEPPACSEAGPSDHPEKQSPSHWSTHQQVPQAPSTSITAKEPPASIINISALASITGKEPLESIIHVSRGEGAPNRPGCCIYKVPDKLRMINEKAYTPKLISIGPFHYGREELRRFVPLKQEYSKAFCGRTGKKESDLLSRIEENEVEIRRCYSEEFNLKSKDFQDMFLLDATFIIELFLRYHEHEQYLRYEELENYPVTDYVLSNPWMTFHIKQDLYLLENQLPYRFLKKFYRSVFDEADDFPLTELAFNFFFPDGHRLSVQQKIEHFTDLQRAVFRPTNHKPAKHSHYLKQTATKLDEAGLEFEKVELDWSKGSLLDIHFAKNKYLERFPCLNFSWLFACLPCFKRCRGIKRVQCILKVPQLEIDEQTETLFRNLMALEQFHYPRDTYICNYIVLLDALITTKEDVCFLVDKEVILNKLGSSKAVTTLINGLGLEIKEDKTCYYDLIEDLTKHCKSPWNSLVASLRSVYFRDFWRGTATIVGILVLCFTFWNFLKPFVLKV